MNQFENNPNPSAEHPVPTKRFPGSEYDIYNFARYYSTSSSAFVEKNHIPERLRKLLGEFIYLDEKSSAKDVPNIYDRVVLYVIDHRLEDKVYRPGPDGPKELKAIAWRKMTKEDVAQIKAKVAKLSEELGNRGMTPNRQVRFSNEDYDFKNRIELNRGIEFLKEFGDRISGKTDEGKAEE